MRAGTIALASVVTGAALAFPGPAIAAPPRTPEPLVGVAPLGTDFADRVLTRPRARTAQSGGTFRAYRAPDGTNVRVRFTAGYRADAGTAQTYVNFLGRLPHGRELGRLRLVLATPSEIRATCGGADVLACYETGANVMYAPGEQLGDSAGVTTEYIVTHEYGHHVANFRANPPWAAIEYGPKRWASYERVCSRAIDGLLAPGDEGRNYLLNPGESWAEVYARLAYPDLPWRFVPLLEPDAGALLTAAADVLRPWTRPRSRTFRGRFTRGGARTRSFTFPLTLDGRLEFRLRGPRGTNFDVGVSALGRRQGATRRRGSRDVLTFARACRERDRERVTVTVTRRSGAGPFTVRAGYPG